LRHHRRTHEHDVLCPLANRWRGLPFRSAGGRWHRGIPQGPHGQAQGALLMKELIAFLAAHPGWFMAWAGCLGLVIGSFLNVIILRLPPRLDWGWRQEASEFLGFEPPGEKAPPAFFEGRSHCPRCKHAICWW